MKLSFSAVVDYVKELLPVFDSLPAVSDCPIDDAQVLLRISGGRVFYITANNGRAYLYVFPHGAENMDLAKYILRSNGLRPRLHMSHYYYEKTPVLRVPYLELYKSPEKRVFADALFNTSPVNIRNDKIDARIDFLQKKMQQKVK